MTLVESWLWLVFVVAGLLLAILELLLGVETGLDLVIIGSAFVLGGLVSWPFHSWMVAVIVTTAIAGTYIVLGRRYVHRWTAANKQMTNIDAIVGRRGITLRAVARNADGLVKVGNEEWRARADERIEPGEEVVVESVSGATLIVQKTKEGGN